jgi:phosphoglucan,water dikinase
LTRIRDIAHRNDIPSDLKQEIKHSLQNKLHRCAGPEDLAVSEALLARITAPGAGYPADFVEQFRLFHGELREFFSARSLDDRLTAILDRAPAQAGQIRSFLAEKAKGAEAFAPALLRKLGEVRLWLYRRLLQPRDAPATQRGTQRPHGFATGAANEEGAGVGEGTRTDGATWEELMLADIALEDYAFVLLSQRLNTFEAATPEPGWLEVLPVLGAALQNAALSGIEPEESKVITWELSAWINGERSGRDEQLRLKAIVERARRLAEVWSGRVLALFGPRAETLGRALGMAEHSLRVFGEAEVRAHFMFPLSNLCSYARRRLRAALNQGGWDVMVPGNAAGYVRVAERLDEPVDPRSGPILVLVRHAAGDEEIPARVMGVVLAHELPHLSHLAVRARQAGVVLAACGEPRLLAEFEQASGKWVESTATTDGVIWHVAAGPTRDPAGPGGSGGAHPARPEPGSLWVLIPQARLATGRVTIPLAEATLENAGGKADGLRRLAEMSRRPRALFKTPPALVVPFGVMEAALGSAPDLEAEYRRLCGVLEAGGRSSEFDNILAQLREVVGRLAVPDPIPSAVVAEFGLEARLMVRSSANCEDLEMMAGAGLYDSVANVTVAGVAAAVGRVWASLWTRRAALSRAQAGIPHAAAHLAVVIQRMVLPRFSFVLHTANPVDGKRSEVYAELVVGLGETLVGGAAGGSPYRLVCAKPSGPVKTLAFANFSHALEPGPTGLVSRLVDYSHIELSCNGAVREALGKRLGAIGVAVEAAFGRPQDIEGVVAGEEIFLVQARAQQGLC